MIGVQCVYITDISGGTIFLHEKYPQCNLDELKHSLFSNFVTAFQSFITELGADASKIVLGKSKIYTLYDKTLDLYFVLKSTKDANSKDMKEVIKKVQLAFKKKLKDTKISIKDIDTLFLEDFRSSIDNLIGPKTSIQNFIEVLNF